MLTDIDRTNADRSAPRPNRHDVQTLGAMAKGTNSVNYISPATNRPLIVDAKSGQFTIVQAVDLNTAATVIAGALSGYNASTNLLYQAPHNLPYTPGVKGFWFDSRLYHSLPYPIMGVSGGAGFWLTYRIAVDATNVFLYGDVLTLGEEVNIGSATFRYYLTQQALN